ncbi:MAG TPA: hypothetical protein VFE58_01115 [Tepidisphaeraceae bacterium]|nr:hypothetical protein [Tepidisphaeraceae bacterium]
MTSLPQAFTVDRLLFDSLPDDHELLALLGDRFHVTFVVKETPDSLTVKPQTIPMKFAILWMSFLAAAFTVFCLYSGFRSEAFWFIVAFLWLGFLPMFLTIFHIINLNIARVKDFLLVDKRQPSLTLPHYNLTFTPADIECFTVVKRRFKSSISIGWDWSCQYGLLVRQPNQHFIYYLILFAKQSTLFPNSTVVDRIAPLFQTTVRHINCDLRTSRALGDFSTPK